MSPAVYEVVNGTIHRPFAQLAPAARPGRKVGRQVDPPLPDAYAIEESENTTRTLPAPSLIAPAGCCPYQGSATVLDHEPVAPVVDNCNVPFPKMSHADPVQTIGLFGATAIPAAVVDAE